MKRILTLLILAALMPAMLTLPAIASERNFPPITEGCGDHTETYISCSGIACDSTDIGCPHRGRTIQGIYHPTDCMMTQYYCSTYKTCLTCGNIEVLSPHYCYIDHAAAGITVHVCENSLSQYE